MTEPATPNNKGLRILLEALTTISYLKGGEGRAAAIAEYALDQFGKTIRNAKASERVSETQLFLIIIRSNAITTVADKSIGER